MATKTYTEDEIVSRLLQRQGERSQKALADEMGISAVYLSDVLNHRRSPGPAILSFLGFELAIVKAEDKAA